MGDVDDPVFALIYWSEMRRLARRRQFEAALYLFEHNTSYTKLARLIGTSAAGVRYILAHPHPYKENHDTPSES